MALAAAFVGAALVRRSHRARRARTHCCAERGPERRRLTSDRHAAARARARLELAACNRRLAAVRALRRSVDARRRLRVAARPPRATALLFALCGVVYLACALSAPIRASVLALCAVGEAPALLAAPYRLLAAGFVHRSLPHFSANGIALLAVGGAVEMLYGAAALLALCAAGAVGGAAGGATSRAGRAGRAPTVGASGALHALVAALIVHLIVNRVALGVRGADTTAAAVGVAVGVALMLAIRTPGVDAGAHVGGFFAGLPAAAALVPDVRRRGNVALVRRAKPVMAVAVAVMAIMAAVAVLAALVAL